MDYTSILNPATRQGAEILRLFYITLGIAACIFTVVAGLVIFACFRYRQREGIAPSQRTENKKIEILWTVIPTLIVTLLFVLTSRVMQQVNPQVADRKPDLVVVGHQWWWEFRYPSQDVTTANEVHLPVGKLQLISVESADVIHDFWVPALGKKVDAIPGHPNHLWTTLTRPGLFLGTCDEFCGAEHAWMRIRLVGMDEKDFQDWIRHQARPAAPPASEEARKGQALFLSMSCANCHTLRGTAAKGTVAPDLTHLADRKTLGAGVLENEPEALFRWIKNPQAVKPGCNMPDLHLSDADARAISTYLGGLK